MDELVTWLREQLADTDRQTDVIDELRTFVEYMTWEVSDAVKALQTDLRAEVEAKRARIDVLADALECGDGYGAPGYASLQDTTQRLLVLEAQPLASRPGFRDEWRLT